MPVDSRHTQQLLETLATCTPNQYTVEVQGYVTTITCPAVGLVWVQTYSPEYGKAHTHRAELHGRYISLRQAQAAVRHHGS